MAHPPKMASTSSTRKRTPAPMAAIFTCDFLKEYPAMTTVSSGDGEGEADGAGVGAGVEDGAGVGVGAGVEETHL